MQVYLVGGAVRDHLLGHPYHEKDYVVVGATPEQLLSEGYQRVGKIIANGSLAMGNDVSMFFTFWGLNALRKEGYM